jgi:hypothetical protein
MKKQTAVVFIVIFGALAFYYFFAEDYCPVHNPIPGGSFTHIHRGAPSVCLCFWNALFAPGSYDFVFLQDAERLPAVAAGLRTAGPFGSDIGRPPRTVQT